MKRLFYPAAVAAVLLLSAFTTVSTIVPANSWKLGEDYSIAFESKNPAGIFKTMTGDINFDPSNLAGSSFDMKVDVASINTGNGTKNKHAVSPKWFDAEKYPHITFKSTQIKKTGNGYEVTGDLEMHGVKKSITFPFTFDNNTFNANFKVLRTDYGIGDTKGMSAKASVELAVNLSVPVMQ